MLERFISNVLSVKLNEWDGVLYFFLVLLVFSFGASFARSIGMTLLIQNLGGNTLPVMYICSDLAVMVGTIIYAHYTRRVSGLKILGFLFLVTTLFSVVMQILFYFTLYRMESFRWVYGFFFIGFFFFYILIFIHSSSVIASYFTAVQVKRVTGVINTGIPIGGALGGSTLVILLNVFKLEPWSLVFVLGLSCLGAFWLLHVINARLSPVRTSIVTQRSTKTPIEELVTAFKYITGSRLMIFMSLGLIVFVIGNKLLEYHYQAIIYPRVFPESVQRATFFATYEIFANLTWLFVQLFLTSRIVMALGVGPSNLLYPSLSAVASLSLYLYFYSDANGYLASSLFIMLALGVVTQFINQEMRGALRTPANNLLFNAIPPNLWGTNKAFLNGIIYPLATLIAGSSLIIITGSTGLSDEQATPWLTPQQLSYVLPFIVFILSILGVIIALPQWAAYNEGVFSLLNRELFERRTDIGASSNGFRQVIEQKLNSNEDPYHVVAALEMIRVLRLNYFVNQVGNLMLKTQNFVIKQHCIDTLSALPQSNTNVTYLMEALKNEEDPHVLPLIIKSLARFPAVNFNSTIEKLLFHPSPPVFVEACLCLYNHPQYTRKQELEKKILLRLGNVKSPQFPLYIYALGELRQARYSDLVLPFLDNEHHEIRLAAFIAYIRMLPGQLEPHKARLITALESPDKEIKLIALRALKECQPVQDWKPIIRLLGAKDRTLVTESKELLRLSLNSCKTALIAQIFSEEVSVQQRFEMLSLVYKKLDIKRREYLRYTADLALRNFIQINGLLKIHLSRPKSSRVHDLIAKVLQEIAENHLLHVLTVITYEADQGLEFFQRVSRGLMSLSRANQGNALEVLSNVGEKYLVSRVLQYFEERLNDIKAFNRIHLIMFAEPLSVNESNYEKQLMDLDHDMLKACLLYVQKEKTGVLSLEGSTPKVRELLTETKQTREVKFFQKNEVIVAYNLKQQ